MADPNALAQVFTAQMRALAERYTNGEIDFATWQAEMVKLLRKQYGMQLIAGADGDVANVTEQDRMNLGVTILAQYAYLQQFIQEVAAGQLTPNQIAARAGLYAQSSRQMYYMAKASAGRGIQLPVYPGDGHSRCRSNCRCSWSEPDEIRDSNGDLIALDYTWEIDEAAENCPDCIEFSQRWRPLRMPVD